MNKQGMIIDSSLSLETKDLSLQEYKERLFHILQPLIAEKFKDEPPKQKIRTYTNRLSMACPYCRDSVKNPYAKRGNVILTGKFHDHYKCFNCGKFMRIDKFLNDMSGEVQLDIAEYISKNKTDFDLSMNKKYDVSLLLDRDEILKYCVTREDLKRKLGLEEVDSHWVHKWLRRRLQFDNQRFLYSPRKNYLAILNLVDEEHVLGLQKRSFAKNDDRFRTYNVSRLNAAFRPGEEVPEEVDSLSVLFGVMQLNFARPVTLFEGPMDAFMFKNSVGSAGALKSFPIDMPLRYWFDDDKTGRKKSIEYIERGEAVFMWEKFRKDYQVPHRKKWDLNDLMIWFKEQHKRVPNFEPYFSDDPLDVMEI